MAPGGLFPLFWEPISPLRGPFPPSGGAIPPLSLWTLLWWTLLGFHHHYPQGGEISPRGKRGNIRCSSCYLVQLLLLLQFGMFHKICAEDSETLDSDDWPISTQNDKDSEGTLIMGFVRIWKIVIFSTFGFVV